MIDETLQTLITLETKRQQDTLSLIPSENYVSQAVRDCVGSDLTNKYSEGYPGKRYYNGNDVIDQIENLAIERAKKLFGVPHANVQPYSGSPANAAIYFSLVTPGDIIMGMKLSAGGHLTHGHSVSFSGTYYTSIQYNVQADGLIDFSEVMALAVSQVPKLIFIGATAYPRVIDWAEWRKVADSVHAILVADISHIAGLVVAGVHPSPVPFVDVVMTTTHKTLRGPRGAMIMVTDRGLARDPDMAKKIDRGVFPGMQGGPHNHVTAGIAQCLAEASDLSFVVYGKQIVANAKALSDTLLSRELDLVTGGTDNHLLLIDLRSVGLTGKVVADALEAVGIVVNRNSVPHDSASPFDPSGIRIGTPAVTTRGMKEPEMVVLGNAIADVIDGLQGKKDFSSVASVVKKLCEQFPVV